MHSPPSFRPRLRSFLNVFLVIGFVFIAFSASPAAAEPNPSQGPDAARVIDMITWLSGEKPFQTTRIFDRNGVLLAEFDEQGRREIVGFDEIPEFLIQATIATEDRRFYEHNGVDYLAIARAAWQNSQSDKIVSGGSTITQQLARLLFMPPSERYEQSLLRKWKEAQIAMDLERYYSKNDVLTMYLNTVYYGHQAYGVAAAAETYFNKSLSELTPAEMALLAGLPQSPVQYDPLENPEEALKRQQTVLSLMVEAGYLTADEAAEIGRQPLELNPYQRPQVQAPHFVDYVRTLLIERYGTVGMASGYQVHTSLDLRYQTLAERIARAQVATAGKKYKFTNAAVVMVHPENGQILAMVGSIDFYNKDIKRGDGGSFTGDEEAAVNAAKQDNRQGKFPADFTQPAHHFSGGKGGFLHRFITASAHGVTYQQDKHKCSRQDPGKKKVVYSGFGDHPVEYQGQAGGEKETETA